ncbi:hypothetical protein BC361_28085 [Ensifer sp. LC54]|nr:MULTISPECIES: DUF2778 domain-containing protein [unclassified Ensifer]OCP20934.1 hypothetical protein BC361_28085 [Ensifer sp. LC54]OCP25539.1 hypothetical protein BC363_19940 [Ensifer sp. LC384]
MLITCCGLAFAGVAAGSVAGMVAMGSFFAHGSGHFLPKPQLHVAGRVKERPWVKQARVKQTPRLVAAAAEPVVLASLTGGRARSAHGPDAPGDAEMSGNAAHFDALARRATVTSEKPASNFRASGSATSRPATAKVVGPALDRFGPPRAGSTDKPEASLAYADPSQSGANGVAFSALLAPPLDDDLAALPDYEDTPSFGPLPQVRPRDNQTQKPAAETENSEIRQAEAGAASKVDETAKADERETPRQQKLAYARPDDPAENRSGGGLGQALRSMFGGGTKAGNGVAVYDISAAKVYMPDGSVLEAHSGIGKMADNPRYVDVKMTGPTPPHTYNLKMRETRFHGVEAIRMLPIDGKNKHGRDGFLTHSYLLRGGRAESHGCVAFKDYRRFLTAFKEGKVRQIVVVPSGGRAAGMQMASNGKNT